MPICGQGATAGGARCRMRVLAGGAPLGAVGGVGAAAVLTLAAARVVAGEGPVPILATSGVRCG